MDNKTFVVSDTWFNRPCGKHSGENHMEYNEKIINNWNKKVSENDDVYVLGGIGICDLYDIFFQLNGNIHFLNPFFSIDEKTSIKNLNRMVSESVNKELKNKISFLNEQILVLKEKDVVLSYYPLLEWPGKETGTLCFHGMTYNTDMNNGNVCCNISNWEDSPVDLNEVVSNISKFKSMI